MSVDDETREEAVEREVPLCSCEEAEMLRALLKRWMVCYDNGDPMGTIYGDTDEALSPKVPHE